MDCCHRFKAIPKLGLCGCYEELGERTKLDLGRQGKTNFRTVIENGEPWFVGKDVAAALGYNNPQKAIRDHVDDEDVTVNKTFTVNGTMATLINESGLYSLVISSKLSSTGSLWRHTKRQHIIYLLPSVKSWLFICHLGLVRRVSCLLLA